MGAGMLPQTGQSKEDASVGSKTRAFLIPESCMKINEMVE
jgi:hypothetical protein